MGPFAERLHSTAKTILKSAGLLPVAHRLAEPVRRYRRERMYRGRFLQFKRHYGSVLRHKLIGSTNGRRVALVSSVHFPEVELELGLLKALELAGFVPVLLTQREEWLLRRYYSLAGVREVYPWNKFADRPDYGAAETAIKPFRSTDELLRFEYEGARVGRFAVSTAFRRLRVGSLDLQSGEDRRVLVHHVALGMGYARAAQRILGKFHPELMVFVDQGYSPKGELFDHCLANGIDVVTWDLAHKNSTLILKRFNVENKDQHASSMSAQSWQSIRDMVWSEGHAQRVQREIYECYANGDWRSVSGTQFNKRFMDADQIRRLLGLDVGKKTAFIFPHISWDATLFWGKSLFRDYEEWLVETVRAACANDQLNWVIRIHPAHVGKAVREGFAGEPAEVISLRKHFDRFPPHIFVIPADSDISTFSLFGLMDYCLTVRGTVGIEAARLGIPVLTAGSGAYDHKDFTIDSETRAGYFERLARIQDIPRLSPEQQALAERFAYGFFLLRPLPLTTVTLRYHASHKKEATRGEIHIRSGNEWRTAPDLNAFAEWVTRPDRPEDFLMPLPED